MRGPEKIISKKFSPPVRTPYPPPIPPNCKSLPIPSSNPAVIASNTPQNSPVSCG